MEDVVKNATTESVKLLEGQKITGELTMKLKTLLHSCTVDYVDIVLYYYDTDRTINQIETEICNRKDFHDFIETYGNSVVYKWAIESEDGIPYMMFDLKNLVIKGIPTVKPTTKLELAWIIEETIEKEGLNCDLNFIDTSLIKDMSCLFQESEFNGNISKWNVSNVKYMNRMFQDSKFNQDISKWNVSKVEDMRAMFYNTYFNGDISKWNVSNVTDMESMFQECPLEENPPEWY